MRTLGAKASLPLSFPAVAAYQILALNTEKAHNLREKAGSHPHVSRTAQLDGATEDTYALEFEEPAYYARSLL